MQKFVFLSFFFLFLLSFCTNNSTTKEYVLDLGKIDAQPTDFKQNATAAFHKMEQSLERFAANRTPQGAIKQDNIPTLLSEILGIFQQFPQDERTVITGFKVAEIIAYSEDYQNAARLFQKMVNTFPPSQKLGHAQLQLGMILDKNLANKDGAITTYRSFIKSYPDHPLVGTAEGLLYELVRYSQQ